MTALVSIADGLLPALLGVPLAIVAIVDARTGRIPDAANAAVFGLGILRVVASAAEAGIGARGFVAGRLLDAAIVVLLLLLLRLAYRRWRGRQGLGLGDVKFLGAATVWTGLAGLPVLVLVASLAALLGAVSTRLAGGGRMSLETRLRFGPYLAGALFSLVVLDIWLRP